MHASCPPSLVSVPEKYLHTDVEWPEGDSLLNQTITFILLVNYFLTSALQVFSNRFLTVEVQLEVLN